ncbi:MAG: hypothetical protein JNJ91_10605 [Flavobacteriales bacterium]|nr:hypothetical protein [Flavobacteriales bacterium]
MADEVEDLKDALKERLKSPFYFSWLIGFVLLNWRAIYIALFPGSDLGFLDRLNWIDANLYGEWWQHLVKIYVGPLTVACLAVAVIPKYIFKLEEKRLDAVVEHKNQRTEIEGKLKVTTSLIGQLTIDKDRLMRALDEEVQLRRKAEQDLEGVKRNFVDSLDKLNGLQEQYQQQMAEVILKNDQLRNLFNHIRRGGTVTGSEWGVDMLLQTLHVIKQEKDMVYSLTEEGMAVSKFIV